MRSKRKVYAKKIQCSAGTCFVLISKEAVETLKLRAQDEGCQLIEIPDPVRDQLIFKVMRLGV